MCPVKSRLNENRFATIDTQRTSAKHKINTARGVTLYLKVEVLRGDLGWKPPAGSRGGGSEPW